MDILQWLVPGGAIGSVVTWLFSRKTRRVDVLQRLQESIDLLTNKYTEVLNENVQLKADNAKLLANQKAMEEKIDTLNRKIDQLTEKLKSKKNDETFTPNADTLRPGNRRVRNSKSSPAVGKRPAGRPGQDRTDGQVSRRQPSEGIPKPSSGDDGDEDGLHGNDSGGTDSVDDCAAEPS